MNEDRSELGPAGSSPPCLPLRSLRFVLKIRRRPLRRHFTFRFSPFTPRPPPLDHISPFTLRASPFAPHLHLARSLGRETHLRPHRRHVSRARRRDRPGLGCLLQSPPSPYPRPGQRHADSRPGEGISSTPDHPLRRPAVTNESAVRMSFPPALLVCGSRVCQAGAGTGGF